MDLKDMWLAAWGGYPQIMFASIIGLLGPLLSSFFAVYGINKTITNNNKTLPPAITRLEKIVSIHEKIDKSAENRDTLNELLENAVNSAAWEVKVLQYTEPNSQIQNTLIKIDPRYTQKDKNYYAITHLWFTELLRIPMTVFFMIVIFSLFSLVIYCFLSIFYPSMLNSDEILIIHKIVVIIIILLISLLMYGLLIFLDAFLVKEEGFIESLDYYYKIPNKEHNNASIKRGYQILSRLHKNSILRNKTGNTTEGTKFIEDLIINENQRLLAYKQRLRVAILLDSIKNGKMLRRRTENINIFKKVINIILNVFLAMWLSRPCFKKNIQKRIKVITKNIDTAVDEIN